ncbi:alkaline phosphatase [Bacteroides pyogenes DSM 20611 = JCM 6294]|uniref:Alkaline phosphatase n=1 Tax=Bacteroides pyogenes DSM 20611 = JCM 6294 TaxID=1121100 RepID=W4PM53_9BACE|nr:alkaline phosphatase [Bacteroides pyogenes DSM 20611 = JCM 6294]
MKGILTSLITALTFTGLQGQSLPAAPKLVVGLTIDQLRTDYLEAFSSLYGEKGFKRLWKEGRVFYNAEYTFSGVDRASAIAAIYTGTTPSVNGIIANQWMDASTLRVVNSTDDKGLWDTTPIRLARRPNC